MAKQRNDASGSTIAGAGGVTAGIGLAAGGVPGARANINPLLHPEPVKGKGVRRAANRVKRRLKTVKAAPGGIIGFRSHAHQGGLYDFSEKAKNAGPAKDASEAFFQGRTAGKVAPEQQILRHMRTGRAAAATALVGGSAAVGYGVRQGDEKKIHKSQRDTDRYNGALVGTGAAGAAASHGATKLLGHERKRWAGKASTSVDEAGKLVPSIAGRQGHRMGGSLKRMHKYKTRNPGQPFPKTMQPTVSDSDIKRNPSLLHGVDTKTAQAAGKLRGAAAQQRHFAEAYGGTEKVVGRLRAPSAIVAGVGLGGMAMSRKKDKVRKSAFGVDHVEKSKKLAPLMSDAEIRRRKKVQGGTSRATSTLGLTALGLTAATVSPRTYGAIGRAAKSPIKSTRGAYRKVKTMSGDERRKAVRGATVPIMAVSGGIGGVGGYNFARYTEAEARKRTQVRKDHPTSAFGVDHSA